MNNKKKTILGAAFVVAIMALAGIGYAAATSFTGSTNSVAQDVDVDYVSIYLSANAYQATVPAGGAHIIYTSVSDSTNTTYTYDSEHVDFLDHTVTIDLSAIENTDKVKLVITGTAPDGAYDVYYTYSQSAISGSESWTKFTGSINIGSDSTTKASATTDGLYTTGHLGLKVVPHDTSSIEVAHGGAGPSTENATIPALTFTLTAANVA